MGQKVGAVPAPVPPDFSTGLEWIVWPADDADPDFDARWAAFDLADLARLYGIRVVRAGERILAVYVTPRPQEWQRGIVDRKAGKDTKAASLATARRLFPDADLGRKKDHGRADALLLAWWARRQGIGAG